MAMEAAKAIAKSITGQCLCGAVTITATPQAESVSACHCSMCRRWSGAALWVLDTSSAEITGPVKRYQSSSFR